ncbi:hypothetical protein TcBrA4_0053170 [Trypanosoma cruzi]|nr:hypothetical protein TcBrA4_0053170 [Trypanosoma cruzi]
MTRKTYMWFDLAPRIFPNASYIAKGDDDIFLRVPLFVAHLRLLPRRGSTWVFMLDHRYGEGPFYTCVVMIGLVLHLVEGCGGGVGVLRTAAAPGIPAVQQGT